MRQNEGPKKHSKNLSKNRFWPPKTFQNRRKIVSKMTLKRESKKKTKMRPRDPKKKIRQPPTCLDKWTGSAKRFESCWSMQLQGTKISNKGQQDQQKQKHPKQQQQAEKSTRQQQSSACTMGQGNPEEAPESFARSLRSLASLAPRNNRRKKTKPSKPHSTKTSHNSPK